MIIAILLGFLCLIQALFLFLAGKRISELLWEIRGLQAALKVKGTDDA